MQANLNQFHQIFTSMSHVQPRGEKKSKTNFTPHTDAYIALPRPPFGKCDNNSILIPAYKQKLKQETPVTRSIKTWSDEAEAKLQDCFDNTDWNMFWDSSDGIEEYNTSVICLNVFTSVIGFDDVVPAVTVRTYPKQKPLLTCNICTKLKARAAAFKEPVL